MLIWQSNLPRFVMYEQVGDTITLHFGITNVDDIELAVFYFIAKLVKHEDGWSIDARLRQTETDPLVLKPQVSALTCKLQLAIETDKHLDFRDYLDNWSKEYRDFCIVITDTALPQVVPTRISPRQDTQNDVNKG